MHGCTRPRTSSDRFVQCLFTVVVLLFIDVKLFVLDLSFVPQRREENLALPSPHIQALESTKAGVETWEYTAKNALMYYPEGEEHLHTLYTPHISLHTAAHSLWLGPVRI